jgi:RNA polymerase sigma factor (sigma-70 family)
MEHPDSTCWTVLNKAAAGNSGERAEFVARYAPLVRAYLAARWRGAPLLQELEDAVQDVFVECLRHGGVLERARPEYPGGFRAFLYGVVRNVALRIEQRRGRRREHQPLDSAELDHLADSDDSLSHVFDRAWATSIMKDTAERQSQHAQTRGEPAQKRVELLRLRFQEGRPIREIAQLWQADPATLHHEYARARQEFKAALLEVMTFHHPESPAEAEEECARLLELLE